MNEANKLYISEPQYVWNAFVGDLMNNIKILPCGLPIENKIQTDIELLNTLPKGRIWYQFNTDAFIDTPSYNVYNEKFFNAIREKDFSLGLLTTSKGVMKYVNILQNIRAVEVGVWFSSDTTQNNVFIQRLDTLRRLYFSDIYTITYLNTEGSIADILNLSELVSGLCYRAYLYGKEAKIVGAIQDIFEEHKKTVFYVE